MQADEDIGEPGAGLGQGEEPGGPPGCRRLEALRKQTEARLNLPPRENWKVIRLMAGVPQGWVADYCEVTRQAVGTWVDGTRTPTGERLARYAEALRVMRAAT